MHYDRNKIYPSFGAWKKAGLNKRSLVKKDQLFLKYELMFLFQVGSYILFKLDLTCPFT